MEKLEPLIPKERACVQRYLDLIEKRLGENLKQIWLFGSAARGDRWPDSSPMRSDIDLLILSQTSVLGEVQRDLFDAKRMRFFSSVDASSRRLFERL